MNPGPAANPRLPELFDPAFLAQVQHLRIVAKRVAPRGRFAEQRSRDRGSGLEFQDHRAYTAGDDLRAIDWNVYRRLGRVFLRLFEELEDLPLYVLPDVSESLWFEDPPRVHACLRCALALSAVSLGQHDSVGVYPFSDDLSVLTRPMAGKNRVFSLAHKLGTIERGGRTDLRASLDRFASMRLREGLVVVISDFFDPAGIEAVTEALGKLRHRLVLVQLTRTVDREPSAGGEDLRVVDCESDDVQDVTVTDAVLERYRGAYDRFQEGLTEFARRRGAGWVPVDADGDIVAQLAALFENGGLRA